MISHLGHISTTVAKMRVEGEERRKGGIITDSLGAIWNMGGDSPKKMVLLIEEKWGKMGDI